MKRTLGTLMVAASAIAISSTANAVEYTPYVGLDYVHSILTTKNSNGFRPDYDGASINAGVNFNEYFGIEAFVTRTDNDNKHLVGDKRKTHYRAYGLDLMGYLPLGCEQKVSLIGTAGVGEYALTSKTIGTKHSTDHGYGYRVGAGAQYDIDEAWAVRGIVRYVNLDKIDGGRDLMDYSVGVKYKF